MSALQKVKFDALMLGDTTASCPHHTTRKTLTVTAPFRYKDIQYENLA